MGYDVFTAWVIVTLLIVLKFTGIQVMAWLIGVENAIAGLALTGGATRHLEQWPQKNYVNFAIYAMRNSIHYAKRK